ncbi:MAG: radical SAM protein [Deltaproteobacteria bacterium]|nr:radical SAM protein [Deltaproteobacteria bacterium]
MVLLPSYVELFQRGLIEERIEEALALMEECRLCPRECGVNRLEDERGFCNTGRRARVASYNAHFGEESPLVGRHGSGTIFISSCNLLCSFCQNYDISHGNEGVDVEPEQMAEMMIQLQKRGCHNINFVTPTHVVPQLLEALSFAIRSGLRMPLVYNSSGYDKEATLRILEGVFDIYMPDFKFWDGKWAERYCKAPDYPEVAREAIREMHRQVGDLVLDENGVAQRGLLVRHLVMPDNIAGTREIMHFLASSISTNTYVNVMDQYRPCGEAYTDEFINRRLKSKEFREAVEAAKREGLHRLDKRDVIRIFFGP